MIANNANDPLAQLRDIHLPPEPSWWPPAIGWWLIAALLVVALVAVLVAMVRRFRAGAPRRYALLELTRLPEHDDLRWCDEVNALLKRVAIRCHPDDRPGPLHGDAWLAFLDRTGGDGSFQSGPGRALGGDRYARAFRCDRAAVRDVALAWVRRQRARVPARRDRAR